MEKNRILVTGAGGQIGQVLGKALEERYGKKNVLSTDLKPIDIFSRFDLLDVLKISEYERIVKDFRPNIIYHLAGVLSAVGETDPDRAWNVNTRGWINTLEVARKYHVNRLFFPSSIAVFGPGSPLSKTSQNVPLHPVTIYGVTKVAGENLGEYYFNKYGLDVRALRYPGIISYQSAPGGGTTDYSVDIFRQALAQNSYDCYIGENTILPMMYIDDAIRGTMQLMDAPAEKLTIRTAYNFSAISFTPKMLADEIRKHIPRFQMNYQPDFRDQIARNWPDIMVDQEARDDWGWEHRYELDQIVTEMINHLAAAGDYNKINI